MNIKTIKIRVLISEEHQRVYSVFQKNRYQFLLYSSVLKNIYDFFLEIPIFSIFLVIDNDIPYQMPC